jgi:uncharacterized repeat protein (TIGR04076 family)
VSDSFELCDLRIEVVSPPGARIYCGAQPGDSFEVRGDMLHLPPGQGFSIYSLAALLPLLPAKQRSADANGCLSSDTEVACPDPNCPTRFQITRLGKRSAAATATPAVPRVSLTPGYEISRIIKGGWQLAGDHGAANPAQAPNDMAAFVEAGITALDCADIYTGVETLIGAFRATYPDLARQVRVHTKFVPDLQSLDSVDAAYVERSIDRSLRRLGVEQLDLVQFHWWDFAKPGYVGAALELDRQRRKGKIAHIGVTNFDVARLAEIRAAGVPILSHQLQYSLLDARPENGMIEFCRQHGIALLCYGTVAGGFLSDRWLGEPEPAGALDNRSLTKYKLIIEDFGGWALFQQLLAVLRKIADRHRCDIATVASQAILQQPGVAAVIVGATNLSHLASNRQIGAIALDGADDAAIRAVTRSRTGPTGDVFALERDREGKHGRIMKYNLNR